MQQMKELQAADENNDLQINDVILSVNHRDVEMVGFHKVVSELKWTDEEDQQRKANEMTRERGKKRLKCDNDYAGAINHGEVFFTCVLQIARVLSEDEDDDEVSYYEDERN